MGRETVKSPVGAVLDSLRGLRNQTPVAYTNRRATVTGIGQVDRADATAQMRAMGAVGTLFAIINRTSTDVSHVDWHMHRLAQRAPRTSATCDVCNQPGATLVTDHPALVVWNRPNDFYTRQEFVESEQQHIDLTGEGWWVVTKLGGRPIELWPVRPDRMAPVPHPTKFLSGYVYRSPDGEKVPLGLDEVIQIRMPNPLDPYRGMGVVQALLTDLDSTRYSAEWNRNFFINGAEPGGVIEFPNRLGDDEWDEFNERWREQHQGVANAHRVATIEAGGKWVDRRYTQRDMQFAELRNVSREVIREAFGMHGHMLGMSESVNRANAEAAEYTNAQHLTVPRLERFKQALNNDFLRLFGDMGQRYEFAYSSPVPADREADNAERESKATTFATLSGAGLHPEDAAVIAGLPPEVAARFERPVAPAPVPVGAAKGGM